jgi:predicted DNA-binding ArsR family transcriptional regulator
MYKIHLTDRFETTMYVSNKFNNLDDLHISLTVDNDLMSIPVFLSKEQVKELINHLKKVIENEQRN